MKRFRELIVEIRKKYPGGDFFADFESSTLGEPIRRKHYRSYNDALMMLDDDSWDILKAKAIDHFKDKREGQRKQGFFNQLNEAFAYRYLLHRGFKNIRLIREASQKRPDIRFDDQEKESYCEVKTIGISDNEIERRSSERVYDGGVYFSLSSGFLNKLGTDIEQAWEQIRSLGNTGLVFIVARFDDISLDYYSRYRQQLTEFCQSRGFTNLIIKIGHRGNMRIRI